MDCKYIENLLERFWKCETSQEEEGILRAFFRQKDIPQSLEPYRSLFVYEDEAKETKLGADFDEKMLKLVEQPSVNARRITLALQLRPFFKAAAAVAIVLVLGNAAQHSFSREGSSAPDYNYATYKDTYKDGWDAIRERRYERMKQLGLFPGADHYLSPRQHPDRWADNPTKEWDARAMAVHAAMVDRMDQGIGQLLDALQENGELDNTLILFLSDNGCSNEICQNYSEGENDRPDMTRLGEKIVYPRHKEVLPGTERTYASVGPIWANVANTPFRFWKAKSYEGGINTPCIAFWPKGMKAQKGSVTSQQAHVIDIMATCIELGRAVYPAIYNGKQIRPMEGRSLVPVLQGEMRNPHEYLGFEHFNEKALISKDGWKIVQPGKNAAWELYNLNEDRTEMHNVATRYPEKLEQLVKAYEQWAERCLVVPAPD